MMKTKWTVFLLLLAAAGGGGWWWFNNSSKEKGPLYETADVTRGSLTVAVSATGTLNPITTVLVGSQVSGRIQELHADFNSVVKAGQLVAMIEPSTFASKVKQSEAAVAKTKANVALAKATLQRQKELMASKLVSQADLEDAQAKYDQDIADLMSAQAALDSTQIDLDHTKIFSPVDGIVLTRAVDIGQTVAASLQAPTLFTIAADLTKMQIDSYVDEADIGQVSVNQPVNFNVDAYSDRTFQGKVTQIRNSPLLQQNVVTYDTIISVDNSDLKLKPGMTANVTIVVATHDDVLRLPNAALRFKPPETPGTAKPTGASESRWSGGSGGPDAKKKGTGARKRAGAQVYTLRGDSLVLVMVKTGLNDGSFTEVLDGLKEGDKVVIGAIQPKNAPGSAAVNPFGGSRMPGGGRRGGGP